MPDELSWVSLSACREVFKAKHRETGQKVALKKVWMENEKEGVSTGLGRGGQACQVLFTGLGFSPAASESFVLRFSLYLVVWKFPRFRDLAFHLNHNSNVLKHLMFYFGASMVGAWRRSS
jgi:hypothetical protein